MSTLTVILKMSERCNLNCSYCYFFNGKDQSYKQRPAFISDKNIDSLIHFLKQGAVDLSIKKVVFGFHGGEPLLFGKEKFAKLCSELKLKLLNVVQVSFSVQTNGLLLDEEWLKIFTKYKKTLLRNAKNVAGKKFVAEDISLTDLVVRNASTILQHIVM